MTQPTDAALTLHMKVCNSLHGSGPCAKRDAVEMALAAAYQRGAADARKAAAEKVRAELDKMAQSLESEPQRYMRWDAADAVEWWWDGLTDDKTGIAAIIEKDAK